MHEERIMAIKRIVTVFNLCEKPFSNINHYLTVEKGEMTEMQFAMEVCCLAESKQATFESRKTNFITMIHSLSLH